MRCRALGCGTPPGSGGTGPGCYRRRPMSDVTPSGAPGHTDTRRGAGVPFDQWMTELSAGEWAHPEGLTVRAGAALRTISTWLLLADLDSPEGQGLVADLEDLARRLPAPHRDTRYRPEHTGDPAQGSAHIHPNGNGTHPVLGPLNPAAPPLRTRYDGTTVSADVVYDTRFEGMPGWVHGGQICVGFDIVLGQAVRSSGASGPTGTLAVRFTAPTPLHQPLVYEGRLDRVEGRKGFAVGSLRTADGTVCATAEGLFIAPRPQE